ncbi:MAG: VCBS repeat-containing protein [Planctomycetota bacterium]|nr:VCBS repeat-containing protein [Planctomycetota bacterium]MDA1114669.1 VCBS repeat-containing protein [Planctomycetota bacterium]
MSPLRKMTLIFLGLTALPLQLSAQETKPEQNLIRGNTQVADGVAENMQFVDPAAEGWRTEVLHDSAKAGLKGFLGWVGHGKELPEKTLAENFRCSVLRPAELDIAFQDDAITVQHAEGNGTLPFDKENVFAAAKSLQLVFEGGTLRDDFFKIITVELNGGHSFRTKFLYHAAISAQPFVTQVNLEGEAIWLVGETDEEVQLQSIDISHYEELATARPAFEDITSAVFAKTPRWRPEMMVGVELMVNRVDRLIGRSFVGSQGIAIGDIDNDGLDDIYVPQQGGLANRLYHHLPNGTVEEVSESAMVDFLDNTRGALFADMDNDGDQDLVVTVRANLLIAYNNGEGIFDTRTVLRYNDAANIYSITVADPDNDGDLDIYACRYVMGGLVGGVPTPYHDANNGATNFFWRNDGNRAFQEAAAEVGLDQNNTKFSLGACWEDIDGDGDVDLYVANDFGRNNLFINDGTGHFTDEAVARGADDIGAAMGVSMSDVDLDGDMDILVTNMFSSAGRRIATQEDRFMDGDAKEVHADYVRHARGNTLLRNNGNGTFTDSTESSRVAIGGWAWGAQFVDINNDGFDDVYSPNGFLTNKGEEDL